MTNYKLGQDTRALPCVHKFHRKCIDEWIVRDRCCPLCRVTIQFCSHPQCKTITIDANYSNTFEVPPAALKAEAFQKGPSGSEDEDDIDRLFNLSFGDLDRFANEEIDFISFRDTIQAIINLASERHHVDVAAIFEELQPGMLSLRRPTTANAQSRSAAEGFRRREPFQSGFNSGCSRATPNSRFRNTPQGQEPIVNKRVLTTQNGTYPSGPSVKRQKHSPRKPSSQKVRNPYYKKSAVGDQPSSSSIQNAQKYRNYYRSIEFDDSKILKIDITGSPQRLRSRCDNMHTIIVENCICCNHDDTEENM